MRQVIKEELVQVLLENNDPDAKAFLEGKINEREFLRRMGRKMVPYMVAGAIGAQSLLSPAALAAPPPPDETTQVQSENSANMQLFLKKYPDVTEGIQTYRFARMVPEEASKAQKQVQETYVKNFDSFERFIRSLKGYENQSTESIKANWEVYVQVASETLGQTPVVTYHENIDKVPEDYIARDIPAFYDADQKKIFINPFFYSAQQGGGQSFNYKDFSEDLKEEYIHAIQSQVREQLKMPIAHMQTKTASELGLFLPQSETGISQGAYNYLTAPQEFHAKMLKLKGNLGIGELDKATLQQLMNSENPPEVLKVLNPDKVDEVLNFFNMVSQSDVEKSSQYA